MLNPVRHGTAKANFAPAGRKAGRNPRNRPRYGPAHVASQGSVAEGVKG